MAIINPTYLGDGVYIQKQDTTNEIILTTGCHYGCEGQSPSNIVIMEPEVTAYFIRWLEQLTGGKWTLPERQGTKESVYDNVDSIINNE